MVFQEWYLALSPLRRAQLCMGITYQGTGFRLSTVESSHDRGAFGFVVSAIIFACREVRNGRNVILSTDKWLTHRETRVRFTKTLSRDTRPVRNVPITTDVSILRIRARQMTSDKHTYEFRKEYTQCT